MKVLVILILTLVCFPIQAQDKAAKLDWLIGKWNRTDVKGDARAFEQWTSSGENYYAGLGVMLEGKDTVFMEKLSINEKEGKLYYVAEVAHNADPTFFEITSIGKTSFTCKNETHDFPKKISYQMENNLLTVTISGNSRSMDFIFLKED